WFGTAHVSKSAASDDESRKCDLVDGDDALHFAGRGLDVSADRGDCYIHHKGVDDEHKLRGNNDGECPPSAARQCPLGFLVRRRIDPHHLFSLHAQPLWRPATSFARGVQPIKLRRLLRKTSFPYRFNKV